MNGCLVWPWSTCTIDLLGLLVVWSWADIETQCVIQAQSLSMLCCAHSVWVLTACHASQTRGMPNAEQHLRLAKLYMDWCSVCLHQPFPTLSTCAWSPSQQQSDSNLSLPHRGYFLCYVKHWQPHIRLSSSIWAWDVGIRNRVTSARPGMLASHFLLLPHENFTATGV